MNCNPLDARNQLRLCYVVELACARWLWLLIQRGGVKDPSLWRFLENQAAQRTCRAWQFRKREDTLGVPVGPLLGEPDLTTRLNSALPSISARLGERPVDREIALHFVECLEEECARFYREMASAASTEELRHCFLAVLNREDSELRQVRTMLL